MFNFSANHLQLIACKEFDKGTVYTMKDSDTKRLYSLYNFQKPLNLNIGNFYCVNGKVNSADNKLFLVVEGHKEDRKFLSLSQSSGE